jgi:hypothetical protein
MLKHRVIPAQQDRPWELYGDLEPIAGKAPAPGRAGEPDETAEVAVFLGVGRFQLRDGRRLGRGRWLVERLILRRLILEARGWPR